MFIDKLQLTITAFKNFNTIMSADEIKKLSSIDLSVDERIAKQDDIQHKSNKLEDLLSSFRSELDDLEEFIQGKTESSMKDMERKLDEVLLGPYYHSGREMMLSAKRDFSKGFCPSEMEHVQEPEE